ncbi:MAG: MBL fold metallo-hydrolase [Actinomycetota bacterium]|nr:MBL fold metallo-hydrolase [Actinomycetota bacterium]
MFDVSVLVDAEGSFATIAEAFPALTSREDWWLPVNAVLVRGAGTTLLVDAGLGPEPRAFMPDADARLLAELARAGVSPDEVDLVVHTHLHVDHVGWDGSFPNARYIVSTDEWSYFMSEDSLAKRPHLRDRVEPLRDAGSVVLVDGELEVASGVRLVPTPGHTPGHASVFIESEGEELVVLGDVVVHELQLADPDLVYVSDEDPELSAATRKQVLARLADEGTDVIAGHFRGPGRFSRQGEAFSWSSLAEEGEAAVE